VATALEESWPRRTSSASNATCMLPIWTDPSLGDCNLQMIMRQVISFWFLDIPCVRNLCRSSTQQPADYAKGSPAPLFSVPLPSFSMGSKPVSPILHDQLTNHSSHLCRPTPKSRQWKCKKIHKCISSAWQDFKARIIVRATRASDGRPDEAMHLHSELTPWCPTLEAKEVKGLFF